MKRLRLLSLAGILILSGGCESTTSTARDGLLVGSLDGEAWRGTARADFALDTISIWSTRQNGDGGEQHILLRIAQSAPGVYSLVTAQTSAQPSRYDETLGGDVFTYSAPVTAATLQVREFDRSRGRASGTFTLTITGSRGTSRLEQGEFDARDWRQPNWR